MNFGDPSAIGTEMADRFVVSGANLHPPLEDRVKWLTWEAGVQITEFPNFKDLQLYENIEFYA